MNVGNAVLTVILVAAFLLLRYSDRLARLAEPNDQVPVMDLHRWPSGSIRVEFRDGRPAETYCPSRAVHDIDHDELIIEVGPNPERLHFPMSNVHCYSVTDTPVDAAS